MGGGFEIGDSRRFAVEARYTHGLRSVFDFGDPADSDSDDKNQMLSLGVEVRLF